MGESVNSHPRQLFPRPWARVLPPLWGGMLSDRGARPGKSTEKATKDPAAGACPGCTLCNSCCVCSGLTAPQRERSGPEQLPRAALSRAAQTPGRCRGARVGCRALQYPDPWHPGDACSQSEGRAESQARGFILSVLVSILSFHYEQRPSRSSHVWRKAEGKLVALLSPCSYSRVSLQ